MCFSGDDSFVTSCAGLCSFDIVQGYYGLGTVIAIIAGFSVFALPVQFNVNWGILKEDIHI